MGFSHINHPAMGGTPISGNLHMSNNGTSGLRRIAPGEWQTKAIAGQFFTPGAPGIGIILLSLISSINEASWGQKPAVYCRPPRDQLWSSHTARPHHQNISKLQSR